jgi:hypothetical protein
MKLKTYRIEDIAEWDPCCNPLDYAPAGTTGTALDVLCMDYVPIGYRVWLAVRMIPLDIAQTFARWCALSVAHLWECTPATRQWLETGDESRRARAHEDAIHASYAASSTWSASDCSIEASSASCAAGAAALANGYSSEAYAAARASQVAKLIEMLEDAK